MCCWCHAHRRLNGRRTLVLLGNSPFSGMLSGIKINIWADRASCIPHVIADVDCTPEETYMTDLLADYD